MLELLKTLPQDKNLRRARASNFSQVQIFGMRRDNDLKLGNLNATWNLMSLNLSRIYNPMGKKSGFSILNEAPPI